VPGQGSRIPAPSRGAGNLGGIGEPEYPFLIPVLGGQFFLGRGLQQGKIGPKNGGSLARDHVVGGCGR